MKLIALVGVASLVWTGCAHARLEGGGRGSHVICEDALGVGGSGQDCDTELDACFTRCWEAERPPYPHVRNSEWYYEYCTRECREQYVACVEQQEKEDAERVKRPPAHEFSNVEQARAWLRAHRAEVALGSVVIVAGTAFILATSAAGALILAPLAL
jgi:hypothetical protein